MQKENMLIFQKFHLRRLPTSINKFDNTFSFERLNRLSSVKNRHIRQKPTSYSCSATPKTLNKLYSIKYFWPFQIRSNAPFRLYPVPVSEYELVGLLFNFYNK